MDASPDEVFGLGALWAAARRAMRGKRRRASVARFGLDLETRLVELSADLRAGRWRPARASEHAILDPKPRVIHVPPVRDRVVHQAVAAVLAPRFERRAIADSYASRVGLGTHAAFRRARAWARTYPWFAHLDVQRYFPSLDHTLMLAEVERDVREPWLLELVRHVLHAYGLPGVFHFPGDDLFSPSTRRVGMPLGTYLSQLLANRFLDRVDHTLKDQLRVRPYLRYLDDFLVFGTSRAEVEARGRALEEACWRLRLRLHPWEARPTHAGVGFVGYRVTRDQVRVRRSTVARAERRLEHLVGEVRAGQADPDELYASLRATFAHWDHADSWRLKGRLLRRLALLPADDLES